MKHVLGTPATEDKEVYREDDETFGAGIFKTKSKQYLMIASYSTMTTEFRVLDANHPEGNFQVFQPRVRGMEYSVDHCGDSFYIRTNWEAENFRLMKTPTNKTSRENWTEVIPEREDVFIENIELQYV